MSIYDNEKPKGIRRYTQQLTLLATFGVILVGIAAVAMLFPGGKALVWSVTTTLGHWINVALAFIAGLALIIVPWIIPIFVGVLVKKADDTIEPNDVISLPVLLLLGVGLGVFGGLLATMGIYFLAWNHEGARTLVSTFGGINPYEVPPVGWGIYGWIAFFIAFIFAVRSED